MDIFQGDPKIELTVEGSKLVFKGGQPVMDQGLENQVLISLFTKKGWCGNSLFADTEQQIGSDFEEIASRPITRTMLIDLEKAAKKALKYDAFGDIQVTVRNPASTRLDIEILISPRSIFYIKSCFIGMIVRCESSVQEPRITYRVIREPSS